MDLFLKITKSSLEWQDNIHLKKYVVYFHDEWCLWKDFEMRSLKIDI